MDNSKLRILTAMAMAQMGMSPLTRKPEYRPDLSKHDPGKIERAAAKRKRKCAKRIADYRECIMGKYE